MFCLLSPAEDAGSSVCAGGCSLWLHRMFVLRASASGGAAAGASLEELGRENGQSITPGEQKRDPGGGEHGAKVG